MKKQLIGLMFCILFVACSSSVLAGQGTTAPFQISTESFMLNGKASVISCAELHFAVIFTNKKINTRPLDGIN
jgi:hypothetical protein